MNRTSIYTKILIFSCSVIFFTTILFPVSGLIIIQNPLLFQNNMIYVDDNNIEGPWNGTLEHPYQFIQDAINAAKDQDIIFVFNGTYNEHIIIDKELTVLGENSESTIIDGSYENKVVSIPHDNVIFSQFTIQNSGYFIEDSGIYIRADNIQIINNVIYNNNEGIFIRDGQANLIQSNRITECEYGVYLYNSNPNNQLLDNSCEQNMIGIYLEESSNNNMNGNNLMFNEYGIMLKFFCDGNSIAGNHFEKNTNLGLLIDHQCFRNIIYHNNFIDNTGHAFFISSFLNIWRQNYWDTWVGIEFSGYEELPKLILGQLIGPLPWPNFDFAPQKEAYPLAK